MRYTFPSLFILLPIITSALVLKSSDGTDIYATALGNPSKPSLVFTHGFALSGIVFDELFQNAMLLNRFYLVCALSIPLVSSASYFVYNVIGCL